MTATTGFLDFCGDDPEAAARAVCETLGVTSEATDDAGNGHPAFNFTGPARSVRRVLRWYHDGGDVTRLPVKNQYPPNLRRTK